MRLDEKERSENEKNIFFPDARASLPKKRMACSFISRTVVPSSRCIGSASGFFLIDDGSSCPCTVLALSDALELLRPRSSAARGGDDDSDGIATTPSACASAPALLFRRRVHGLVRAVAKLSVKVCFMGKKASWDVRERSRNGTEVCCVHSVAPLSQAHRNSSSSALSQPPPPPKKKTIQNNNRAPRAISSCCSRTPGESLY